MTTVGSAAANNGAHSASWLGRLRAVIFATWVVKIGGASLDRVGSLPTEILEPPWLLQAVPPWAWEWLLRANVLHGLQLSICILSSMAAVGVRPYRPIAAIAVVLITFEQGLVRSYGYSTHPEMFLLLATWIVSCAPAADGFSWPARRATQRPAAIYAAAIAFIALVGCWTYTAAAAYRVAHHGLEMFTSASMNYFIVYNSFSNGSGASGIFVLEHPAVARWIQLSFPVATVLELLAPLALLFRGFRRAWVIFLVVFQLFIAVLMTFMFGESTLALVAALVAFDRAVATDSA